MLDVANNMGIVSPEQLRICSRQLAAGVAIVTTRDVAGHPYGLTMTSVLCLSLEPPLFLICISEKSDTLRPLLESRLFAINVLDHSHEWIARRFALKGCTEKFRHFIHDLSIPAQLPVLRGALAVIECEVMDAYSGGDHRIVVGMVRAASASEGEPLVYHDGHYSGVDPCGPA